MVLSLSSGLTMAGSWVKNTNTGASSQTLRMPLRHVPFMIRVPGVTDQGMRTKAFVELIDIITELAGLDVPPVYPVENKKVLGTSVVPLLNYPQKRWKKA